MSRPLMQHGIRDLEDLFERSTGELNALKLLEGELKHRQVPRAIALRAKVRDVIERITSTGAQRSLIDTLDVPTLISKRREDARAESALLTKSSSQTGPTTGEQPHKPKNIEVPLAPGLVVPLEEAYKVLKATPGTSWESIEQARQQLVLSSHPTQLKMVSTDKRDQKLAEVKRVNAAYLTLSRARCNGH